MKKVYYNSEEYCILPLNETEKAKVRIINVVFGSMMFLLFGVAGIINPDSSRTAWIVFPYLFLFLPCAYMLFGAHSFWNAPVKMHRAVYQSSIMRMKHSCWGVIVLAITNIILDIVYMGIYRENVHWLKEMSYCGCLILLLIVGILFGKYFDKTYTPVQMMK